MSDNHKHPTEMEEILQGAHFLPDAAFEDRLRARLVGSIPAAPKRTQRPMFLQFLRREPRAGEINQPMNRSRGIALFSFGLITLMVALFVGLVLVRPSGVGADPTDQIAFGQDAEFDGVLKLASYEVRQSGLSWTVVLGWMPITTPPTDYMISIHLWKDGSLTNQLDAPLIGDDLVSSYSEDYDLPPTVWKPNHFLQSTYTITLNEGDPTPDAITIGLINPSTGEPVVIMKDGLLVQNRVVIIYGTPPSDSAADITPIVVPTDIPTTIPEPMPTATAAAASTAGFSMLSMSGDSNWIAVETRSNGSTWPQILLFNGLTGETSTVAGGGWPSLDADGDTLAFVIQPRVEAYLGWNRENVVNLYSNGEFADVSVSSRVQLASQPVISADGNVIAFTAGGGNSPSKVYVYDRRDGGLEEITHTGNEDTAFFTSFSSLSADGRYIAYFAMSPVANPESGVVVLDREEDRMVGYVPNGFFPQISPDGSTVAYLESVGETQEAVGWINARTYNVQTGETRWLGRVLDAGPDGGWSERIFSISEDGSKIAFRSVLADPRDPSIPAPSPSGGLGSAYVNSYVFLYDWATDTLHRVDAPTNSIHPEGYSYSPVISADGEEVAYLWHSLDRMQYGVYVYDFLLDTIRPVPISVP